MSVVIITGSGGLIGSEAAQYFCQKGFTVAGMDNDMRQYFFGPEANGTLCLLEATRQICPEAVFIFTSTNKVYGDRPNELPLVEENTRWELDRRHPYYEHGIPETMSIDYTKHSLFGASKTAADILVQEYGRYFNMISACFRGGCLTGPGHSGTQLHGFLSYLMRCTATGAPYGNLLAEYGAMGGQLTSSRPSDR